MEGDGWTATYCLDVQGFPLILWETLMRFGYTQHPEYRGREYQEHGTSKCEVHVLVFETPEHTDWQPWSVVAYGAEYSETYQAAARKALLHFCEKHEKDTGRTPSEILSSK